MAPCGSFRPIILCKPVKNFCVLVPDLGNIQLSETRSLPSKPTVLKRKVYEGRDKSARETRQCRQDCNCGTKPEVARRGGCIRECVRRKEGFSHPKYREGGFGRVPTGKEGDRQV